MNSFSVERGVGAAPRAKVERDSGTTGSTLGRERPALCVAVQTAVHVPAVTRATSVPAIRVGCGPGRSGCFT